MNIVKSNLLLNQEGFEFGDEFNHVLKHISIIAKIVKDNKKYISTEELLFCNYCYTSTFVFRDKKLKSIKLHPALRKYMNEEEFENRDENAVAKLSNEIISLLKELFKLVSQTESEYYFVFENKKIALFFSKEFDSFTVEITNV